MIRNQILLLASNIDVDKQMSEPGIGARDGDTYGAGVLEQDGPRVENPRGS
jgi:hypothetical protein